MVIGFSKPQLIYLAIPNTWTEPGQFNPELI